MQINKHVIARKTCFSKQSHDRKLLILKQITSAFSMPSNGMKKDAVNFASKNTISFGKKTEYNEKATKKLKEMCYNYDWSSILPHPLLDALLFCRDVKKQIKNGADPNINLYGYQLLDMILMTCDSPGTIKCLLKHGADATYINHSGYSALEFAHKNKRKKSAEVLERWEQYHDIDLL